MQATASSLCADDAPSRPVCTASESCCSFQCSCRPFLLSFPISPLCLFRLRPITSTAARNSDVGHASPPPSRFVLHPWTNTYSPLPSLSHRHSLSVRSYLSTAILGDAPICSSAFFTPSSSSRLQLPATYTRVPTLLLCLTDLLHPSAYHRDPDSFTCVYDAPGRARAPSKSTSDKAGGASGKGKGNESAAVDPEVVASLARQVGELARFLLLGLCSSVLLR